jgi:hypothetical protein
MGNRSEHDSMKMRRTQIALIAAAISVWLGAVLELQASADAPGADAGIEIDLG